MARGATNVLTWTTCKLLVSSSENVMSCGSSFLILPMTHNHYVALGTICPMAYGPLVTPKWRAMISCTVRAHLMDLNCTPYSIPSNICRRCVDGTGDLLNYYILILALLFRGSTDAKA